MSVVTVTTNVAGRNIPVFFQAALTNIAHTALDKPKEVLFVDLKADANLMLGGNRNPCVVATVQCVGSLTPDLTLSTARQMEEFFMQHLNVTRDRIVIRFIPVPAEFCTFNGALHDLSIETDRDHVITQ